MDHSYQEPHQGQPLLAAGRSLEGASAAMILVHGRGATAQSILELGAALADPELAYLAPQASGNSWYPYSFMAPIAQNEPGITSGLQALADAVTIVEDAGIPADKIILGGFSQGACLASEFVARHARRYGGLLVFSGGLIGPPGTSRQYEGSLAGMPVFIGCSDIDPHIPVNRVKETAATFANLGASVTQEIYSGMGHTVIDDEIDQAMRIVESVLS